MWWGRKDDDTNSSASSSRKKRTASTPSKKSRLGSGRQKASASASLNSRRRPLLGKKNRSLRSEHEETDQEDPDITAITATAVPTNETEQSTVSPVPTEARKEVFQPPPSPPKTLVSFHRELQVQEKVHRAQFNVTQWPALTKNNGSDPRKNSTTPIVGAPPNAKTGRHRVKLAGGEDLSEAQLSFQDMVFLLKNHQVVDEATCIETEIKLLNSELDALKEDRAHLEAMSLQLPEDPTKKPSDWEKQRLLAGRRITQAQRKLLQAKRGTSLTISMKNGTIAKALAESLGAKKMELNDYTADDRPHKVLHLSTQNCRDGGAGTTVQNVCLSREDNEEPSFFVSHDHGKGSCVGRLPARLFRRMKDNGMDPNDAASNLVFLASGPMDYYFAEFRSGEVWWGSPPSDESYQTLCNEWDVYRVAFGPVSHLFNGTSDSKEHVSTSWIILSRDGRVAWKNIPTSLHYLLASRLADEAAVEEVSLGSGGSYFVRFLDGTVDYCLPAHMGSVCQKLEQDGASLTGVSLHPDLPHDFVVRSARGGVE